MSILIHRQRSLARTGAIRMGETRISQGGKAYPAQRETFRFTSANKAALEMLAEVYGGDVHPWADHPGEFEVCSNANQISVIIDTTLSVDEQFTRYDGQTRTHKCDGLNCHFVDLKRAGKKIVSCEDRGLVKCLCDPKGRGAELPDEERKCDLATSLKVILPATGDVVLWQFSSKGATFNKEVFATIDMLRGMGFRQGYCHLTIHMVKKVLGEEVSKFGVARLTLDPNPPNFVAALLAKTPEAQARALLEGAHLTPAPALNGGSAPALEAPKPKGSEQANAAAAYIATLELTTEDVARLDAFKKACAEKQESWAKKVLAAKEQGFDSLKTEEFFEFLEGVDATPFVPTENVTVQPELV